jgi:hypothetical protein
MTLLWTIIAIWSCLAMLLPIYVLYKAMFRPDLRLLMPKPSTWVMLLIGFAGLGFAFHQSRCKMSFA